MTYLFIGLVLVFFGLSLAFKKALRTKEKMIETLLLYLLVFCVGFTGLMAFSGHVFMADKVAESIGWAVGSPFQFEVGMANLAFGIIGILCIWIRRSFWLATAIGWAVFLFGAAYGHIRDLTTHSNSAINNSGAVLWIGDIALPLIILVLALVYINMNAKSNKCC